MRILLINDGATPHTGGMNRVVVETCECLAQAGHQVALAYHDEHPVTVSCPTFHVPERWPMRQRLGELHRVVEAFQPDVIQNHSSKILPGLEAMSSRYPTCIFFHDQSWFCSSLDRVGRDLTPCHRAHGLQCLPLHYSFGCGGRNPIGNWQRWRHIQERIRPRGMRRLRVQVASEFMRRGLLENGFPTERIDLVPLFAQPPEESSAPSEAGLMLVASRLVASKGVQIAIEAAAKLVDPNWTLAIAGEGPQRVELEALAKRLGIDRRVRFLGEIAPAELNHWFARAQVVLFPVLRQEPFGLVGVEALAHGRPVIAFDGGGVEEWLWPDETGTLVTRRTAEAFSSAIEALLNNPARCRIMGAAARRRYEMFRPEAYVTRLMTAFERTCDWFIQTQREPEKRR